MMTIRMHVVSGALISSVLLGAGALAGCERSGNDEQHRVEEAKREAAKKTAEAENTAQTEVTSAQMEADKKIAKASGDFEKNRSEYRDDFNKGVADLDKRIAKIESNAKTATGKTKSEIDAALPNIREKQKALHQDMGMIDSATLQTWDATKNKIDTDKQALSDAIDKVPMMAR